MSDVFARRAHGWQRIALKLSADKVLKYSVIASVSRANPQSILTQNHDSETYVHIRLRVSLNILHNCGLIVRFDNFFDCYEVY